MKPTTLSALLEPGAALVVMGPGGVGKTTVAAALGLAGAAAQLSTLVLTVDPARRLRDALGLGPLSPAPTRLDPRRLARAGIGPGGRLFAMAFDARQAWDAMLERYVSDVAVRRRILNNSFYQGLSGRFAGAEACAAFAILYDLYASRRFDLAVVDTPPAADALELIDAPARLLRLFDSTTARWLFTSASPRRAGVPGLAAKAARFVAGELERFAGTKVLGAVADFFAALSGASESIAALLRKTQALLRSDALRLVLVTQPNEATLRQTRVLCASARQRGLRVGAVVVNRIGDLGTARALAAATGDEPGFVQGFGAARLRRLVSSALGRSPGLEALTHYLEAFSRQERRELDRLKEFARALGPGIAVFALPELPLPVGNLKALAQMLSSVYPAAPATRAKRGAAAARGS
jgi:anion-transporting  ArsA/GET3 family ATPase